MATPKTPLAEAERRIAACNAAYKAGHRPPGAMGSGIGAIAVAADALGMDRNTLQSSLPKIKRDHDLVPDWAIARYEAQQGDAPDFDLIHPIPEGMTSRGPSIRYGADGKIDTYWNKMKPQGRDPDEVVKLADPKKIAKLATLTDSQGKVIQQWVSERPEDIAREKLWLEFAKALADDLPRVDPTPAPTSTNDNLCACYPVGDHHFGMYAWSEETGGDYDLKIAEKLLVDATNHLVGIAPPSDQALVVFLGDLQHYDSFQSVTPTNRNLLDADSRFPKMVRTTIRSMRYLIETAAKRHGRVSVIIEPGNHDPSSSIFLMECLRNIYENDPRIVIDTSPMNYHYFEFGKVLIGTHHGDKTKVENLPLIMATDRPEAWGRTTFRYVWTGHVHHDEAKDVAGCKVEKFRVLAALDAYAHQHGYRSMRDMKSIVMHRDHGEVQRNTVNPSMFL